MRKTLYGLIAAAVCMMASTQAHAQLKPITLNHEVNVMAGIKGPSGASGDPQGLYAAYYSGYSAKGLGFRTGLEVGQLGDDMAKYVGVPVHFLWKFGYQTSVQSALRSGVSNAAYSTVRSVLYGQKPDLERTLADFLLGLFRNMQVFAGITPGYVSANNAGYANINDGPFYTHDVMEGFDGFVGYKSSQFGLSADLGVGMSFQAGPLEFSILPGFHYALTGNYSNHPNQPSRLYYSVQASLGFMF